MPIFNFKITDMLKSGQSRHIFFSAKLVLSIQSRRMDELGRIDKLACTKSAVK
jgi:hypothetical protein